RHRQLPAALLAPDLRAHRRSARGHEGVRHGGEWWSWAGAPHPVIAEVKLTHPRRSNFDPPGRGWRLFSSRRDVDPGASGGDQGSRTTRALDSADHERDGAIA